MANKHSDCRNFVTIDVTKGICHRTGEIIATDTDTCEHFTLMPKCRNCAFFADGDAEGIGTCGAEKHRPWTYPELIAVTCTMYEKQEAAPAD